MKFKTLLIFALVFQNFILFSNKALAAKTLIRSSGSRQSDYQIFLAKNKDYKSPQIISPKNEIINLKNLFKLAEIEFLASDLSQSTRLYKEITQRALDNFWSKEALEIIFKSYFRLAQLEKEKTNFWISKAIQFNNTLLPDKTSTPVSFIDIFNTLKTEMKSENLILKNDLDSLQNIFINSSEKIDRIYPETLYRLDLVSDLYGHQTKFLNGTDLIRKNIYQLNLKAIVDGNCTSYSTKSRKSASSQFAFLGPHCKILFLDHHSKVKNEKLSKKPILLNTLLPQKNLPTKEISFSELSQFDSQNYQTENLIEQQSKTKIKKSKNKWLYIASGLIAVTLGAMFIQKQNDSSEAYEPTSRQGF